MLHQQHPCIELEHISSSSRKLEDGIFSTTYRVMSSIVSNSLRHYSVQPFVEGLTASNITLHVVPTIFFLEILKRSN